MKLNRLFSAFAFTTLLLSVSCQKDEPVDVPERPLHQERLFFSIEEEDALTIETKSVLDGTIETRRSGVTVGVYKDGVLTESVYSTSFSDLTFLLDESQA